MITLALFNNRGGVGKTMLAYHLAHMMARIGYRVLAVDLDPQSNLTAALMDEEKLEALWQEHDPQPRDVLSLIDEPLFPWQALPARSGTIADGVRPLQERSGDIEYFDPIEIRSALALAPGDLALSGFEDELSASWPLSFTGDIGALRVTSAFHRIIRHATDAMNADIAIIDVGPNLGAINRAALLAADAVLIPLAAELFSLRGLSNLGPRLREWREHWQKRVLPMASDQIDLPKGVMEPIGYVVMQPVLRLSRPIRPYEQWLQRIPVVYSYSVLGQRGQRLTSPDDRSHEIASLRNYQSLMPLAHDARKPMFDLRPGDGALGATADFVRRCYEDFHELAKDVASRLGLQPNISVRL